MAGAKPVFAAGADTCLTTGAHPPLSCGRCNICLATGATPALRQVERLLPLSATHPPTHPSIHPPTPSSVERAGEVQPERALRRAGTLPGGSVARGGALRAERGGQVVQAQGLGQLGVQQGQAGHLGGAGGGRSEEERIRIATVYVL